MKPQARKAARNPWNSFFSEKKKISAEKKLEKNVLQKPTFKSLQNVHSSRRASAPKALDGVRESIRSEDIVWKARAANNRTPLPRRIEDNAKDIRRERL